MHLRSRTGRERGEAQYQIFTRFGLASNQDIDGATFRRNSEVDRYRGCLLELAANDTIHH